MTALVTGASSGLGRALCLALDARKIPLILVARREEELRTLAASLSQPAHILPADLSKRQDRNKIIAAIRIHHPTLIINNAGFGLYGPLLNHTSEDWEEMLSVNGQAVMDLTLAGARALQEAKQKGTILNVSSAAAFFSYPTFAVYAASKAFVLHFSEAADTELAPDGIRVLTVCPGQIHTEFRTRAAQGYPQAKEKMLIPMEKAVRLILKQIDTGKSCLIIDWRYRLAVALSRLMPQKILRALLNRSLRSRFPRKT